jgi:hypothetical protein
MRAANRRAPGAANARRCGGLGAWLALLATAAAAATPDGTPRSRVALAACHRAQEARGAEAQRALTEGLAAAEAAVAADEQDALAHFALFCNLGQQMV